MLFDYIFLTQRIFTRQLKLGLSSYPETSKRRFVAKENADLFSKYLNNILNQDPLFIKNIKLENCGEVFPHDFRRLKSQINGFD